MHTHSELKWKAHCEIH